MLPWDWDIDTQVSAATLTYLATHMNRTIHHYSSPSPSSDSHKSIHRKYLLDINPHATDPTRGDGSNIIDARWIDTRNGLFIDITALHETHPNEAPGVWTCKNYHRYRTSDLFPLREGEYEGVRASIPYAYERILREEYGVEAFVLTEFHGWVFLFEFGPSGWTGCLGVMPH